MTAIESQKQKIHCFVDNRHVPFPEIVEFRKVSKTVNERCEFYKVARRPIITFRGTVKLHGANAAVVLHRGGKIFSQGRYELCTELNNLYGFYEFVEETRNEWQALLESLLNSPEFAEDDTIAIYGEWCGGKVQRIVAIEGLPLMFIVFRLKTQKAGMIKKDGVEVPGYISTYHSEETHHALVRDKIKPNPTFDKKVYSSLDFETQLVTIDFNSPQEQQNLLGDLTMKVENECPVGRHFGKLGIGEGIVWVAIDDENVPFRVNDLIFKVKGPEHSDTRVKKLASVDVEKIKTVREFAERVTTDHRLEKGEAFLKEKLNGEPLFIPENVSAFIKWVTSDVIKEETDTLEANGLDRTDVLRIVAARARQWFISKIPSSD